MHVSHIRDISCGCESRQCIFRACMTLRNSRTIRAGALPQGRPRDRQGAWSCRHPARPPSRHATGPCGCGTLSRPAGPILTRSCACGMGTDPRPVHSCRRSDAENHSSFPVLSLRTRICPFSIISTIVPFMPRSSGLTAASSLTTTISPALKSTSGSPLPAVPVALPGAHGPPWSTIRQSCQ